MDHLSAKVVTRHCTKSNGPRKTAIPELWAYYSQHLNELPHRKHPSTVTVQNHSLRLSWNPVVSLNIPEVESDKQGLVEEFELIRSKDADKDAKRKIVPKDGVKKNIARSPDNGDCFIMRMFFGLQKPVSFIPGTDYRARKELSGDAGLALAIDTAHIALDTSYRRRHSVQR